MKQETTDAIKKHAGSADSAIIAACLKGDAAAWEALIYRYQRLIYSIPFKARLSPDAAADVFQSVCLKLYENLAELRDQERLSAWIITTTSRECWRLSARQRREAPGALNDEETSDSLSHISSDAPPPDEELIALERQQAVRQAVAALPERCNQLLTMLFYQKEELNYQEIAWQMGMPVPSVGPTRARCLEKLKKLLHGKI